MLSIDGAIDCPPEAIPGGAIPEVGAIVNDISLDGMLHHVVQRFEGAALKQTKVRTNLNTLNTERYTKY